MDSFTDSTFEDSLNTIGFFVLVIIAASLRMLSKRAEDIEVAPYKEIYENLEVYTNDICLGDVGQLDENKIMSILDVHKTTFGNAEILKNSVECGCFGCVERFEFSDIRYWIDDDPIKTAHCPKCSFDGVVGFKRNNEKNDLILKALNHRYL